MNRPSHRLRPLLRQLAASLALSMVVAGCESAGVDTIVVATSWPESDCRRIEADFARWLTRPDEATDRPTRLVWVRLAAGDDPARRADRFQGVDVILGGPIASYHRLAEAGGLASIDQKPAWRVASDLSPRIVIGPTDPVSLTQADSRLSTTWTENYATLVRDNATSREIETAQGRGSRVPAATWVHSSRRNREWLSIASGDSRLREGVGVLKEARDLDRSMAFLRSIPILASEVATSENAAIVDLQADLLGAALLDAQEELKIAWSALNRSGIGLDSPGFRALVEPPPWPPAFVTRLKASKTKAALLETLAEQIAPNPYDRAWLLESWERAPRPINASFFREIVAVGAGRLATDQEFRAWLRSEWTAWARRHYREIARSARANKS